MNTQGKEGNGKASYVHFINPHSVFLQQEKVRCHVSGYSVWQHPIFDLGRRWDGENAYKKKPFNNKSPESYE